MTIQTKVNGIKAKHSIVTPTCIKNKGVDNAALEAVNHLLNEYKHLTKLPANENANFNFVLTVERTD